MKFDPAAESAPPEPAGGVVLPFVEPSRALPRSLVAQVLALSAPVLVVQFLNMLVGVNDTYLADHLPHQAAAAGAAVGTITYFIWFIGLLASSVGAGSTAIIARAKGARHRSLANSVCGQSITAAIVVGLFVGAIFFVFDDAIVFVTRLQGPAHDMAVIYLRMLSVTLPFSLVLAIGGACLNGAGDTLTPSLVMVLVNVINAAMSWALTRGWFGLPVLGFNGIALGTIIAYVAGGVIQLLVLFRPGRVLRLYSHRLRPHWSTIRRLTRIGIPAGITDFLSWVANIGVIAVVNQIDPTNASGAAHMTAIRLESLSFMTGIAFATAAATLVGINLGMGDPRRAKQSAYVAYAIGGGVMALCGILLIFFGRYPAALLAPNDPHIIDLTARCLRITGFIQSGFAASLVFGGALRGAGDTMTVMILNLSTIIGIRFVGVLVVGLYLKDGLTGIWVILAGELFLRGVLVYLRFLHGGWRDTQV